MRKLIISAAILIGLSACCTTRKSETIRAYEAYYKHTEALLDSLDNRYNWVDALDPMGYYDTKAKLDTLRAN